MLGAVDVRRVVINAAVGLSYMQESPPGSNRGEGVNACLAVCGLGPGYAWCAAWAVFVLVVVLGDACPIPRSADCDVLLAWGRARGVVTDVPSPGAIALRLKSPTDADHCMIVTAALGAGRFATREGNTNDAGSRDGVRAMRRERGGAGDPARYLFLEWWRA